MSGPAYERNKFALQMCEPSQWQIFERFAGMFMADDYPRLKSVGRFSGDRGRDCYLMVR